MKKFLPIYITLLIISYNCFSQQSYWQQQANFTIDVSLNDKEHSLNGFATIEYINNSPDTLHFIWFHLWPNAYKNDKTAFSDQLLGNGNTKFYFSGKEQKGYINRLDFKVNNSTATLEDHPQHIDIGKLLLPSPLPPRQSIIITTPFHIKLPYNFSRGGHDGESYQITQWYPKPAVYDKNGWHPMPYLDQGEFYSEFGSYDVRITLPKNYVVAATGELQNAEEKEWLKSRSTFSWEPVSQKEKNKQGVEKAIKKLYPESSAENKTLRYKQDNIHDFAWFADKRFIVNYDTCQLASGKIIEAYSYCTPAQKNTWNEAVSFTKNAIHHYSTWVGEYPYNIVSVVQGPESFGGGMEYPTITVISPTGSAKQLDRTIAHEVGHNWFYGILASNERKHPWMDEGINSYYEEKYNRSKATRFTQHMEQMMLETFAATKRDQPMATASEDFSEANYALIAYYKTSQWMKGLEKESGTAAFNKAMQEYYNRWQFKHPQPEDLKKVLEEVSGKNLDAAFSLLTQKGNLPGPEKKGIGLQGPLGNLAGGNNDKQTALTLFPSLGINSYDKLMVGIGITNLRLPPNRFQFLLMPMYATGSKKLNGLGFASYSLYPEKLFRKVDISVSGSSFTANRYANADNNKVSMGFQKITPGIRLMLNEKNARSTFYKYIQFKNFFISEEALQFYRDTAITGTDTIISVKHRKNEESRTLNQLKLVIENNRALYPYKGELKIEQGNHFARLGFTGAYFFNYPKEGGLNVRLFAGKFFYTSGKTINKQFETSRYHLNMTGPNGYEDYTYSDYFIGRNQFQGAASQQIMERDGAFKVRTDLLANKVGRTDDWLAAINFSTTIPDAVNPLNLLPVKIPLKLFLDIGTYADTWKPDAEEDRFLFNAGLHLPLLKETINIYIPLVYSKVYKDYIQSVVEKKGRFWKKISFSIDISNFSLRKIDRNLYF